MSSDLLNKIQEAIHESWKKAVGLLIISVGGLVYHKYEAIHNDINNTKTRIAQLEMKQQKDIDDLKVYLELKIKDTDDIHKNYIQSFGDLYNKEIKDIWEGIARRKDQILKTEDDMTKRINRANDFIRIQSGQIFELARTKK
jgi:hypothetical protein